MAMHDFEREGIQFDVQKFRDVAHYIIAFAFKEGGPEALGNTKLHKALYYSDFLHYLREMKPLTGADYQRQKFGPTARYLSSTLQHLEQVGCVRMKSVNYFGYTKREYIPLREPSTERLSKSEIELIEHVTRFVCNRSAVEISEFSHDAVWNSVPMGARIPYFSAFAMFPVAFTEDDIAEAQAEVDALIPAMEEAVREGGLL